MQTLNTEQGLLFLLTTSILKYYTKDQNSHKNLNNFCTKLSNRLKDDVYLYLIKYKVSAKNVCKLINESFFRRYFCSDGLFINCGFNELKGEGYSDRCNDECNDICNNSKDILKDNRCNKNRCNSKDILKDNNNINNINNKYINYILSSYPLPLKNKTILSNFFLTTLDGIYSPLIESEYYLSNLDDCLYLIKK